MKIFLDKKGKVDLGLSVSTYFNIFEYYQIISVWDKEVHSTVFW